MLVPKIFTPSLLLALEQRAKAKTKSSFRRFDDVIPETEARYESIWFRVCQ